jgi:plasmid stabilization system protein ParE
MNTEQGFTLHPAAAQDITDIWEFIVEDNPLAARRVREDILDAVRKLVPFPHQGHKRPDLTTKPLRMLVYRMWYNRLWQISASSPKAKKDPRPTFKVNASGPSFTGLRPAESRLGNG